jgi:hypothetical protein
MIQISQPSSVGNVKSTNDPKIYWTETATVLPDKFWTREIN